MNQPAGICYASSWMEDQGSLYRLHPDEPLDPQGHNTPDHLSEPGFPSEPDADYQPHFLSSSPPYIDGWYDDAGIGIDEPGDIQMDMESFNGQAQAEQKYTEMYQGCSNAFPGSSTFMQWFWQDKHTEKRRENLYFPFASSNEWQFVSWCLRSGLSMAAIDSLLSLNVVSDGYFCFTTGC
ncbi:hypothetical protein JVT61DRAFT_7456 [Boletus reticuloceps]|uniref:Uncharacterized protein n=1 Tax=Boletus reticuloceps TaxID=495285 RepID=A0A8I2YIW4_9AGAM|nr:hypothetical protein JVT61DRAFT_7456 [Boletus reticuloceps]